MAFGRKQRQIEELSGQLGECQDEVSRLSGKLALESVTGRLSDEVRKELAGMEAAGLLMEDAENAAFVAVIVAERGRLTTELSERLKKDEYDKLAAEFRVSEGPAILERLRELFTHDGTFEEVREEVKRDVSAGLQSELLERERESARQELSNPAVQQAFTAQKSEELKTLGAFVQVRADIRKELEEAWGKTVEAGLAADIRAEEEAREESFKAADLEKLRGGEKTQKFRDKVRAELEKEWKEKTPVQLEEMVRDEELAKLIANRVQLEKEKLARTNRAEEMIQHFDRRGVDVAKLEDGMRVEIYLGSYGPVKVKENYRDNHGYDRERTVVVNKLACQRKLILVSEGKGKFIVQADSLRDAKSEYIRNDSLPRGTVIVIGRKVSENGEAHLENLLAADVPFYYDVDTSTPESITDAKLTVANIIIDGVSARKVDEVEMA